MDKIFKQLKMNKMNKNLMLIKAILLKSFLLVLTLFVIPSCSTDEKQTVVTKTQLVMSEEFDVDGAPDPSIWSFDEGRGPLDDGWGNKEMQFYTKRAENAVVKDGYLIITAVEEDYQGSTYTSARLKTRNLFEQKYGRFEARIKMPLGRGMFPAFWMLGSNFCEAQSRDLNNNVFCDSSKPNYETGNVLWPQSGEIDIMEYIGSKPTQVFGTVHGPGYSGGEGKSKKYTLPNDRFDNDFHIFGIEWGENYINWYVDDVLYNQITPKDVPGEWVFNQPFYMLLNLAVGGNLPGPPNAETVFPQTMMIDYVRVYQ
jgi:beta-glucanase (GH16 family)